MMHLFFFVAVFPWPFSSRYDPVYGARPLKRAIQREVETTLAKRIISGEITAGDTLIADVINERLVISTKGADSVMPQPPAATKGIGP